MPLKIALKIIKKMDKTVIKLCKGNPIHENSI